MKKIKLLPSIIMLALCLCVLGIGVYSATTGSNTIYGTMTVNGAGHEVDIAVYQATSSGATGARQIDTKFSSHLYGKLLGSITGSRAGKDIELSDIVFNSDTVNTFNEVDMIDLIIAVTNKSNKDVGIYFWNKGNATVAPNQAQIEAEVEFIENPWQYNVTVSSTDVLYGHQNLYADTDTGKVTPIVDAEYSFYHHLPGYYTMTGTAGTDNNYKYGEYTDTGSSNGDKRYYTEYMHVYLRLKEAGFTAESKEITLNLNLNVEEYVPNFTESSDGETFDVPFVKVKSGVYAHFAEDADWTNDNITHVVLPYGALNMNWEGDACFSEGASAGGCDAMVALSIPSSVTDFGCGVSGCGLESLILPNSISSLSDTFFLHNITSIYIPSSVTANLNSIFATSDYYDSCPLLERIDVDPNNSVYTDGHSNSIIKKSNNELVVGCKGTVIPNTVQIISSEAFFKCTGLTAITIPSSVTSIGNSAFNECSGLTRVVFNGNLAYAYTLPDVSGYHWTKSGVTVTSIATGVAGQGTYLRVANS